MTGVLKQPKGSPFLVKSKPNTFFANWKDLIKIYGEVSRGIVKKTHLSFAALYPTIFELQNLSVTQNIFHEKTKAVLVQHIT